MSPSRRRSDVPEFDPYGYSPFDAQFKAQNEANANAAAQLEARGGYDDRRGPPAGRLDDYDRSPDRGHRRSAKTSGSRRSSRARDRDDGWETDYDPRDRYYLSDEDQHKSSRRYSKDEHKPKSSSRDRDGDSHRRDHHSSHHSSSKSKSGGHSSRDRDSSERSNRHHSSHRSSSPSSRPKAMARDSSYGGGGGRPRAVGRNSSYGSSNGGGSRRPHAVTRGSSYAGRPRGAKYPPNASRSKGFASKGAGKSADKGPGNTGRDCMGQAAKAALKAGAIAALKVSSERGSFVDKGTKVASAALGAAAVDALLTRKKPAYRGGKRHGMAKEVAEMAIGLLVAKPAMKGLDHRRPIMGM